IAKPEVGMKSDRDRHRFGRQVLDLRGHFERAALEPVGHFNRVSEWKLFYPRWLLVEIEAACRPGGFCIGLRLHEPPVRCGGQKTVNWNGAPYVSQLHVEC